MFERFTDRGRHVVILAKEEAGLLGHNYIGTEHFVLGLIRDGDGLAADALASFDITLGAVQEKVEAIVGRGEQQQSGHVPFTPRAKQVLELALRESDQLGHSYVGTEHILLGLIREGQGIGVQALTALGLELVPLRERVMQLLSGYPVEPAVQTQPEASVGGTPAGTEEDLAGVNLTAAARQSRLDPVVARERELDRVMQVLTRRTRNNVVLVGGSGVGKTAVVHALAQRFAGSMVPDVFQGRPLFAVDLRAESESRLREAFTEARRRDGGLLLFAEDMEDLFGLPTPTATLIQHLVGNHEAQLISTSSPEGFRRVVQGDRRLLSLFQDVTIAEPDRTTALEMMKKVRDRFEVYHRISITDAALVEAVRLGERYVHDRRLPASAVDLIDEAGARTRIRRVKTRPYLRDFDERIAQVRRDKESAIDAQDFDRAGQLRDYEKQLLGQKAQLEKDWKILDDQALEVDDEQVREVVEQMLKERIDGESAAPTVADGSGQVFADGDVWTMA